MGTMTLTERLRALGFDGNELGHEAADYIEGLEKRIKNINAECRTGDIVQVLDGLQNRLAVIALREPMSPVEDHLVNIVQCLVAVVTHDQKCRRGLSHD